MSILVNVVNQKMYVSSNADGLVAGSQQFVQFKFNLSSEWDRLMTFAQFRQGDGAYNQYLDEDNCVYLPAEIGVGTCTMMLYGSHDTTIGTTNYLTFKIGKNNLVSDAESTDISQSLYDQLVTKINALTSWNGQSVADLEADVQDLQAQMSRKAAQADLINEIARAKASEDANAAAIELKANQSQVDELEIKVTELANNEVVADLIEEAVKQEMADYLASGTLANLTIEDGSVTRAKVDKSISSSLDKADTAMQPSVYDPQNLKVDIYSYAQGRADMVSTEVETVRQEIADAYKLTDTVKYTKLGDAVRGAVTLSRNYTQALLADYKAFTIEIVDELPAAGNAQTFYLIPKESGDGYDKYWYITDAGGNSVWDVFGGSSTEVVDALPEVGEADVDYILKSNSGYLYYKYIDGFWQIVAGSLAYVSTALPDVSTGSEYTDYYIVSPDNGTYTHYRYINGEFRVIGGDSYTKDEINEKISAINEEQDATNQRVNANETNISSLSSALTKLRQDFNSLNVEGYTYYATYGTTALIATGEVKDHVYTLYQCKEGSKDNPVSQFVIDGGGGGTGDITTTNLVVERVTSSPIVATPTDKIKIQYTYSSTDSDGEEIDGSYTWKLGGAIIATGSCIQGLNEFDATEFVNIGTQKLTLTVVDDGDSAVVKNWTVQIVDVRLESAFSDRYTNPVGRDVSFTYTPYGSVNKTVHVKIDGEGETFTTAAFGTVQSYIVPAQPHGSHLLEMWMTAKVGNVDVATDHIFKDIIWYDENSNTPVIGCIYRSDYYSEARDYNEKQPGRVYARQYDTTVIPYNVFDPSTGYPTIERYVDGELIGADVATSSYNTWNFKSDEVGLHELVIKVGNTSVTILVDVQPLGIDVDPIKANLEVDFNPTGMSNNSEDREWTNGTYSMVPSANFDWANGGYKVDANGDPYFLIKAGTHVTLNYLMFGGGIEANPSIRGSEMKLIFMTENVQDKDAIWLTNVEQTTTEVDGATHTTNMGIQLGVHEGWLKTNSASDTDVKSGDGKETIAATNTYLYMPYSEEDIIELDINIEAINREDTTAKAFVMSYEDGVPSKAFVYDVNDRFYQYSPKPFVIGSDSCDVRIYRMKIYSSSLNTEEVMKNFIADSRDSTTMLARYDRNSIYYNNEKNEYTPYSSGGILDPERLAPIIPNVKVLMLETDHFTTSKKTFVKSKFRCIHAAGGKVYAGDPYHDNWLFENGYHSGQGTTSDDYGNSGRNVDFLFNADGVHKPSDKVDAEAGYVSKVTLGYGTENATTESVTDWKGDAGKVALTRTSVPNNFFNLKVNVASSENVNNALLAKRYSDFLPYISPAKQRDPRIKNTMEFVPAVLFLKETNPDVSTHNEFMDTNWHFYALGNIGDSKKTDYTRAYDPEDMNEFVIEISDNTKNNATFQSGVFIDGDGNRKIERFTITESEEDGDIILTPVSVDKPQSFVYPITKEEWEHEDNMRHWSIYNEGFDGDHSFEPRYACCGDYRDGKLVNDTTGRGKAQVELNNDVWRAFYRWVITSTNDEFKNELDQWCVRSAVEFFYAFTHIYTMMDNRAKNTFWHFAKTGVYREVSEPVSELLHIYCELIDGEYVTTADTEIDSSKTYYTQYAFDLWDYDNDTALGINNNGELIFPYGREDSDYYIEGDPSSGYVFNGATSVFWCRLRDLLSDEIRSTFQNVTAECFSADNLIQEFDEYQECYPEEIWRLDVQRKYIRTFTGESIDNSKPKHDVKYLRDMMQGRKKYQRRQWVRDQEMYFGTMNLMDSVVGDDNRITFRCFTPTGELAVKPDYTLKITPYSDIYLSVMFGNGGTKQVRAKGGREYTIECPLSTMDDTQVTIYGANRIQALNDLSACYITANNFSMADKLRKLVLGNTTPGYNNNKLVSLTLGRNKLLEELDIRNCGNLTGALNLAECSNLLRLYAEGTKLTGVTFATNCNVQTAHLPSTINTLTMRNLNNLTDFQATLEALETLTLQGGTLDSLDVIRDCIDTLRVLYLYDIDWTGSKSLSDTVLLNNIHNLFYSMLTGSVYVSGNIRNQEIRGYANAWPDLKVGYDPNNLVPQYLVKYVNADDAETVLYEVYVDQNSLPPDPYADGPIAKPTLPSTAQYDYSFGIEVDGVYTRGSGWDDIDSPVTEAGRVIKAQYTETIRTYTVTWYSRAGLPLGSTTADYGTDVVYPRGTPTDDSKQDIGVYSVFAGWNKSTGFIQEDTDVYAIWEEATPPAIGTDLKDMTPAQIFAVTQSGNTEKHFELKDYFDMNLGHDFDFENVESEVLAENLYLDGETAIDKQITLFGENDRSFTMAIDFQYSDTTINGTLVSCFEEDGSEGFRLRFNSSPDIQWGDVSAKFGSGKYRDMVVIRHRKGDDKLYVYASNGVDSNNSFSADITKTELTRSRHTSTPSILTFGAIRFIADGGYDDYGHGHIHWCKIWYEDIGDTNARQLAAWTHEPLRMEYYGTGLYRLTGGGSQKANASFICNHLLAGRGYQMNTSGTNVGGWEESLLRTKLMARLRQAMPTVWQSMMKQVRIGASAGGQSTEIIPSNDYMYLPCIAELNGSSWDVPYNSEGIHIGWYTNGQARAKFRGYKIPDGASYYSAGTDPTTNPANSVKFGDVWINTNNSNTAHTYVDAEYLSHYGITPSEYASDGGAWIASSSWWLRSPNATTTTSFWLISGYGTAYDRASTYSYGICPCFSI